MGTRRVAAFCAEPGARRSFPFWLPADRRDGTSVAYDLAERLRTGAGPTEVTTVRAKPFKQDSTTAHPPMVTNECVREALAKQAASRPAKGPPRSMPVTPTLPKIPKLHRRRRGGK